MNIFIADFHALNQAEGRENLQEYSRSLAATLLALGLSQEQCTLYRQSDVPETFELMVFLTNFTAKGLMNRAHAYKAVVQANEEKGNKPDELDKGVNMGLYNYPILQAADILVFDTDKVPVGKDQAQHIEFARDIAGSVNAVYGEVLRVPEGMISDTLPEVPGLDGRKMSKSYGNTIPVFAEQKQVLKLCKSIKTDSKAPEEPKDPDDSILYTLYTQMATPEEAKTFHEAFIPGGMGYGAAKQALADLLETKFGAARERYNTLMANPAEIDAVLKAGAEKARPRAAAVVERLRKAAGIGVHLA